ncbi:MAG TPA: transporter, partial [Syntrophorhabdaceae bacterium]|nr:transporter [Syntrophorhabdaceae bacterium]
MEVGIESSSRKINEDDVWKEEKETELQAVITYGIKDNLDIIISIPYMWKKDREDGVTVFKKDKLSDISLETKWRFFEKNSFAIALKPGITLPSGNYKQEFGAGRITYGGKFIISKEIAPLGLHFNAGYQRNENKVGERKDLLSSSFALTIEPIKNLTIGGDIGIESNCCPKTKTPLAFFLFGANYKIGQHLTVDAGLKLGLNRYEVDHAFIAGFTLNF